MSPSTAPDPHFLRVHPDRLAGQLRVLRRLGLRGVSLGELARAAEAGRARRLVGLTFDDGYTDFLEHAVPVLRRAGMTATVFALGGRLGGSSAWDEPPHLPLMDRRQLQAVAAAGMEVGSHGLDHVRLAEVDADTVKREVVESRAVLEDVVGAPVDSFAYPYGSWNADVAAAVAAAGYAQACVTKDYSDRGRFTLPRFFVGQRDTGPRLPAKLARHAARRPLRAGTR